MMRTGVIKYKNVIQDISIFFEKQIKIGINKGVSKSRFILDPGIGFGKAVEQNVEIIKNLSHFKKFSLAILVGISRKSHLGTVLKKNLNLENIPGPNERLEAGLAETAVAVLNGATIVRTHDILKTKRFLAVLDNFL